MQTSATEGTGIEALKDAIRTAVWSGEVRADMLPAMINARHQDALRRARAGLADSLAGLRTEATLELIAMDYASPQTPSAKSLAKPPLKTCSTACLASLY